MTAETFKKTALYLCLSLAAPLLAETPPEILMAAAPAVAASTASALSAPAPGASPAGADADEVAGLESVAEGEDLEAVPLDDDAPPAVGVSTPPAASSSTGPAFSPAAPAMGEDDPPPAAAPSPAPLPARAVAAEKAADLADGAQVVELTLPELIRDVVYTNPAVEKARLDWMASLHGTAAAWGGFEPELVGEYTRSSTDRENSTLEMLQQGGFNARFLEDRRDYKVAVEGKVFSGAAYSLGYTLIRNNNNLTTNNEYQSFAGVTVQQPLLKNAWYGSPLAAVKVAKLDRRIAFHSFRARLMQTLYEAEAAYWALAFAEEKHKAAGESVDIARKLVRDGMERVRSGVMSRLDLVEAEAGLASRLGALSDAREELLDAVNRIKLILSDERVDKKSWIRAATPMYDPADRAAPPAVTDQYIAEALRVQPGYLTRRYERDRGEAAVRFRKDQSLPELNFKGSYGYNSLGTTRRQSWEKLKDREHKAWSTGVEVRVPFLLGVEERSLLAAERFKAESAEESLQAAEYEIVSSLKTLRRRILSLRQRIDDARKVVDFRRRLLDAELSRMRAGKSNTRVIFEAEEDLSQAREFELESRVRHREASLQFAVVSGSLLVEQGLEKVQDGAPLVGAPAVGPR